MAEAQRIEISCPACQARYRLDRSKIRGKGAKITCPRCKHVFVIYADQMASGQSSAAGAFGGADSPSTTGGRRLSRQETVIAPRLPDEEDEPSAEVAFTPRSARVKEGDADHLNFKEVGISTWKVKVAIGLVYDFSDIQTLRRYMRDNRVTSEDFISYDKQNWVQIGSLESLDAYFVDIYNRAKAGELDGVSKKPATRIMPAVKPEDEPPTTSSLPTSGGSPSSGPSARPVPSRKPRGRAPRSRTGKGAAPVTLQRASVRSARPSGGSGGSQRGMYALAAVAVLLIGGGIWWATRGPAPTQAGGQGETVATGQDEAGSGGAVSAEEADEIRDRLEARWREDEERLRREAEAARQEDGIEGDEDLTGERRLVPVVRGGNAGASQGLSFSDTGPSRPSPSSGGGGAGGSLSAQGHADAANSAFSRGSYSDAARHYVSAINGGVSDTFVIYRAGQAHTRINSHGRAAGYFRRAAEGGMAQAWRDAGNAYEAAGQRSQAVSAFQSYLSRSPNASDASQIQAKIQRLGGS